MVLHMVIWSNVLNVSRYFMIFFPLHKKMYFSFQERNQNTIFSLGRSITSSNVLSYMVCTTSYSGLVISDVSCSSITLLRASPNFTHWFFNPLSFYLLRHIVYWTFLLRFGSCSSTFPPLNRSRETIHSYFVWIRDHFLSWGKWEEICYVFPFPAMLWGKLFLVVPHPNLHNLRPWFSFHLLNLTPYPQLTSSLHDKWHFLIHKAASYCNFTLSSMRWIIIGMLWVVPIISKSFIFFLFSSKIWISSLDFLGSYIIFTIFYRDPFFLLTMVFTLASKY